MRIDARSTRLRIRALGPFDEVAIERILGHHQPERADRCDDVVHPSRGLRPLADVADGGLAERPDFELQAVGRRPRRGAAPGRPVARAACRTARAVRAVIEPVVARRRAVNRMPDVVHVPGVGVLPLSRHPHRVAVVGPERAAELLPGLLLKRDADRVLDREQLERIADARRARRCAAATAKADGRRHWRLLQRCGGGEQRRVGQGERGR